MGERLDYFLLIEGNCWSYSRSQHLSSYFKSQSVTRAGKETAFLPPPPQRTHRETFTAMGSRMAKAPSPDAGLVRQHKSCANVILLDHLIAETRALNCNEAVSSKLPCVGLQIQAHDSHTSRKFAPFRVRAKSEPLCEPLQPAVRFLRVLLPAPTNSAPCGLPAVSQYSASLAVNRAYHVPNLADATKYVRLSV